MMGSRDSLISPISFEGDGRLASAIQVCESDLSAVGSEMRARRGLAAPE